MDIWTLRDFNVSNSIVILRIDINSPVDPETGEVLSDYRMRSHTDTISYLIANDAKVVILAHQSRPGASDFTFLKEHSEILSKYVGPIKYVDEIASSRVLREIKEMKPGEAILLENVRFNSEEMVLENAPIEKQKRALFVRRLSSVATFYVNDAFAAAHRSQPSITAFPYLLPSAAGLLMEKEIRSLSKVLEIKANYKLAALGGAKIDDSIKIAKRLLTEFDYNAIVTGGLVGLVFLYAEGVDIGKDNKKILEKNARDIQKLIETARSLLKEYKDRIYVPIDLAINKDGTRYEVEVSETAKIEGPALDIGLGTILEYKEVIRRADAILFNGPFGAYEFPLFALGTYEIVNEIARTKAYKVAGGGHTTSVIEQLKMEGFFDHVSTGGGAMISFIAGESLPAIKALEDSKRIFFQKIKENNILS